MKLLFVSALSVECIDFDLTFSVFTMKLLAKLYSISAKHNTIAYTMLFPFLQTIVLYFWEICIH